DRGHVLAVAADRLAALAAGLGGLLRVELVSRAALVSGPAAPAGDLAPLLGVHRRETPLLIPRHDTISFFRWHDGNLLQDNTAGGTDPAIPAPARVGLIPVKRCRPLKVTLARRRRPWPGAGPARAAGSRVRGRGPRCPGPRRRGAPGAPPRAASGRGVGPRP